MVSGESEVLSIRYVLVFFIIVFLQEILYIFPPPVHVYIRALDPQMNTSVIHNMVYKASFFVGSGLFSSPSKTLCIFPPRRRLFFLSGDSEIMPSVHRYT
jgi:hypothetical protein